MPENGPGLLYSSQIIGRRNQKIWKIFKGQWELVARINQLHKTNLELGGKTCDESINFLSH